MTNHPKRDRSKHRSHCVKTDISFACSLYQKDSLGIQKCFKLETTLPTSGCESRRLADTADQSSSGSNFIGAHLSIRELTKRSCSICIRAIVQHTNKLSGSWFKRVDELIFARRFVLMDVEATSVVYPLFLQRCRRERIDATTPEQDVRKSPNRLVVLGITFCKIRSRGLFRNCQSRTREKFEKQSKRIRC